MQLVDALSSILMYDYAPQKTIGNPLPFLTVTPLFSAPDTQIGLNLKIRTKCAVEVFPVGPDPASSMPECLNSLNVWNRMQPFPVRDALVVDADQDLKDLLAGVLEPGVWAIQYVPTNRDALQAARNKAFELIITSEKTSGKEDVELLRTIRLARPHTRLIILADESTPEDVLAAMGNHAFSFFSKPYSRERLGEMIQLATEVPCWDDGIELRSATPEWIRLDVRCQIRTADRLLQFMKEMAELPETEREEVGMAFREILLNAMEHGGRFDPQTHVQVEYVRAQRMISCRITDPGPGFTLDEIPHAAVANPPGDPVRHAKLRDELGLRPGGLGILLAQNLVDQVIYGQQGNEVLLIKYLHPPQTKTLEEINRQGVA